MKDYIKVNELRCHIGFSGYFNFDIAYWRKSDRLILCDINPTQVIFMKQTIKSIKENKNRQLFKDDMIHYSKMKDKEFVIEMTNKSYHKNYKHHGMIYSPNISTDESYKNLNEFTNESIFISQLNYELNRKGSWLYDDNGYDYIRHLAINDLIAIFCEDIIAFPSQKIKKLLLDNHIVVDTIYTSNIYDFIRHYNAYNTFIQLLCAPKTLVIESELRVGLCQTVVTGDKLLSYIN